MSERLLPLRGRRASSSPTGDPSVFLSYAHDEQPMALAFRDALASRGLLVTIDVDHLNPAEDIAEFARRSVRSADATICLVSAASLSSAWVIFEAITTLHKEHADPATRLIACSLDDAFQDESFRLTVTRRLDERVAGINQLVGEYLAKGLDMNDLSAQRSRFLNMRASLGDVLDRLRNSLTLALVTETVADVATRVADHVRALRGQAPSRTDPRDIRARAEELRRHLWEGRTEDALGRLLDFVREFSDRPKHLRDATLIANTLRRIEQAETEDELSFNEAETQRQPAIYKFLELIDEIEITPVLPVAS